MTCLESNAPWSSKVFSDPNATSDDYFEEIIEKIDLTKIYKIVDTRFYHSADDIVAILVEVMDPNLKKLHNDKRYLL